MTHHGNIAYPEPLDFLVELGIDEMSVAQEAQLSEHDGLHDEQSFEHDHWCDDCGDYLNAALRLAAELQGGYLNATELGTAGVLMELAETDEGTGWCSLMANYACDGPCNELDEAVRTICKAKGWPYFDDDDEPTEDNDAPVR
jgi:hypothetical protein